VGLEEGKRERSKRNMRRKGNGESFESQL